MHPLRIGMIGYGFMGRAHSNAWRKVGNFFDLEYEPVLKAVAARKPVWHSTQGGGHLAAGKEWRAACRLILKRVK